MAEEGVVGAVDISRRPKRKFKPFYSKYCLHTVIIIIPSYRYSNLGSTQLTSKLLELELARLRPKCFFTG